MFRSILIAVISVLKLSGCSPSNPVNRNAPGGPRCYSCPSVEEPYLCNVTTQCGHDEQCYTDEYSTNGGTNIFSVGCRRISECYTAIVQRSVSSKRDVKPLKCVECCHGNLCNRGGCSAGLGKSNVCYNCRFIKDPRRCQHETICQGDEHCFIEKVLTQIYDIKYIQGCVENAECQRLRQFGLPVGKRDKTISTMCASCCYGDRCNDECFLNGTSPGKYLSTSPTPYISPSMSTAAPVLYTARATSSISPLMTTDATVVDTKIQPSSSNPPRISTVFLDSSEAPPASPSMNTDTATANGVQSSLLATSTFHELSTIRHGVTASPSTSTTPSMSTHGTSPGKEMTTICHADCDGLSGCILPKIQTCSGATPYCFTQVDNADSGAFNIKKRCADRTTCNTKWWHQTSDDDRCVDYKQGNMNTFSCFYCCTTDKCNLDNIQPSSLFKGDD
ncbi:uncharacterized protein LOC124284505 isoform X9 [Haliotis rubra]|uniref:uncharacterized protein LOC124284505 isoform X9 n=1 Tax=Haliotis rubra TaxID=36100 RepID=UPI001EE6178D|nr:uncharacterized protein LOC124284505 isoform X9 [Haliotis rubra]